MKPIVLFLGAVLCTSFAFAQTANKIPTDAQRSDVVTEKVNKVADVSNEASTRKLIGPARKNPLAGGRAGSKSTTASAVAPLNRAQLTGPTYKNRKPEIRTVDEDQPKKVSRIPVKTGPRYKNRSAKSGG